MFQIPFDMPFREAFEAEDYLVSGANRAAVDWIDRWPDWNDGHCTIFYGSAGCGKTHLSHVWQHRSAAERAEIDQIGIDQIGTLNRRDIPGNLIIEAIDTILVNPGVQERLFHLYNDQKDSGGTLMLTANRHPKYWPLTLPDLKSRMLAAMTIEIGPPDDELLAAVIIKQFADRQINIPMAVVHYLVPRMERSFESARIIVGQIDSLALAQKRKITIPLVRDLLDQQIKIS